MTSLTFFVMNVKNMLRIPAISKTEAMYRSDAGRARSPTFNFMIAKERTLIRYQMKIAKIKGMISFWPMKRMKKTVTVMPSQRKLRKRGDGGA